MKQPGAQEGVTQALSRVNPARFVAFGSCSSAPSGRASRGF